MAVGRGTWALMLIVAGVLIGLGSLFADALGLGREPGVGWKQGLGVLVGVALVVVGAVTCRRP